MISGLARLCDDWISRSLYHTSIFTYLWPSGCGKTDTPTSVLKRVERPGKTMRSQGSMLLGTPAHRHILPCTAKKRKHSQELAVKLAVRTLFCTICFASLPEGHQGYNLSLRNFQKGAHPLKGFPRHFEQSKPIHYGLLVPERQRCCQPCSCSSRSACGGS